MTRAEAVADGQKVAGDVVAIKAQLRSAVASIASAMTALGTVLAKAEAIREVDPALVDTGVIVEAQAMQTDASAALAQYADMIQGLLGGAK